MASTPWDILGLLGQEEGHEDRLGYNTGKRKLWRFCAKKYKKPCSFVRCREEVFIDREGYRFRGRHFMRCINPDPEFGYREDKRVCYSTKPQNNDGL